MKTTGRPPGNGEKWWRDAVQRAVKKMRRGETVEPLEKIADRLVKEAMAGDIMAIKEIGDRLDGKAVQANTHSGPDGGAIQVAGSLELRYRDVKPN